VVITFAEATAAPDSSLGSGDNWQPWQDRAQRAEPPAASIALASHDRPSASGAYGIARSYEEARDD
jgi:hypothetical protein